MDSNKRILKPPIKISILEKSENEVSYCWKAWMIFSYTIILISGIATSLAIGSLIKMFGNECILYSTPSNVKVKNRTITISSPNYWGSMNYCNFCQFCPVASVIFAGIWGVLFVMCGRGGNPDSNLPQPWRIVPPAIIFNFVFVILSCVSVGLTYGGFSSFCDAILMEVKVPSCEDLDEYTWHDYDKAQFFYDDVIIAEVGSAITLVAWLMGFLILTIRCIRHADFHIVTRPLHNSNIDESSPDEETAITSIAHSSSSPTTLPLINRKDNEPLISLSSTTAESPISQSSSSSPTTSTTHKNS